METFLKREKVHIVCLTLHICHCQILLLTYLYITYSHSHSPHYHIHSLHSLSLFLLLTLSLSLLLFHFLSYSLTHSPHSLLTQLLSLTHSFFFLWPYFQTPQAAGHILPSRLTKNNKLPTQRELDTNNELRKAVWTYLRDPALTYCPLWKVCYRNQYTIHVLSLTLIHSLTFSLSNFTPTHICTHTTRIPTPHTYPHTYSSHLLSHLPSHQLISTFTPTRLITYLLTSYVH